jgi:hypothetical protein
MWQIAQHHVPVVEEQWARREGKENVYHATERSNGAVTREMYGIGEWEHLIVDEIIFLGVGLNPTELQERFPYGNRQVFDDGTEFFSLIVNTEVQGWSR